MILGNGILLFEHFVLCTLAHIYVCIFSSKMNQRNFQDDL